MTGYGTDEDFEAWAATNGYTVPETPSVAVLRQRGSAYLDGLYGPRFSGLPTDGFSQERAWPRTAAEAYGVSIPSDEVPLAIEQASYFAAYQEALKPGSLAVSASQGGALKRKKIEGLEKEFFEGSGDAVADATLRFSAIEGLVAPFLTRPLPAVFVV